MRDWIVTKTPRLHRRQALPCAFGVAVFLVGMCIAGRVLAEPVSGTVLDGETLKPIAAAAVTVQDTELSATTDQAGAYRFADLPVGSLLVIIAAEGYEPVTEKLDIPAGGLDNALFLLLPPGVASEIIEVVEEAPTLPTPPGQTDLRREELTRIPGTRGDALTSIKNLPGVANANAAGAGAGQIVIRGAAPEDSTVLIDGVEIPILYHFFGLQSILPSEFIETIDFLPGGFGAEEGRATGGVIRISTRSKEVEETSGFVEMSFINVAGFIQGPISKERHLQFSAGIRRSTIDFFLPAVIPDDANIQFTTAPQYYDAQARIDWRPSYKHQVTGLGLISFDLLTLLNDSINPNEPLLAGKWDNETSFARSIVTWRYTSDRLENRLVTSFGTSGFRFEIGTERFLRFEQRSLEMREDILFNATPRLKLRTGGDIRLVENDATIRFPLPPPEGGVPGNFSTSPLIERSEVIENHDGSAYIAADFRPLPRTTITPGLRVDYFRRFRATTLSPRLSAEQMIGDRVTARLALGSYSRGPQQNELLQQNLKPEVATQYVVGADYNIRDGVKLSSSLFYTDRRQLVVQDAALAMTDPNNAYINRGFGRSFGAELLLRAKLSDFFGWVSYTLSRSDRIDGPMSERRLFDFDQTHNVIVVGSYTLGSWQIGGRWQYNTGSPITPIEDALYIADLNIYTPVYGDSNSARLEPAHQFDLRIDRTWRFRTWSLSGYVDITNVYANPRVLGYTYNFDYSEQQAIEELPFVPALGLRGAF